MISLNQRNNPTHTRSIMKSNKIIKSASVGPMPASIFDPAPSVTVVYEDGSKERILPKFYADEVSFTESEFVGLTRIDAVRLCRDRVDAAAELTREVATR